MNTKNYYFNIDIKISTNMEASSKEEAVRFLKDLFERDHNLELTDDEITYEGEDK
jgi:hypothetical protein